MATVRLYPSRCWSMSDYASKVANVQAPKLRNFLDKGIDVKKPAEDEEDSTVIDLRAFTRAPLPGAESLIPKDWITPDLILDVEFTSKVPGRDNISSADMKYTKNPADSFERVAKCLIKWRSQPYSDCAFRCQAFDMASDSIYAQVHGARRSLQNRKDLMLSTPPTRIGFIPEASSSQGSVEIRPLL